MGCADARLQRTVGGRNLPGHLGVNDWRPSLRPIAQRVSRAFRSPIGSGGTAATGYTKPADCQSAGLQPKVGITLVSTTRMFAKGCEAQ